MSGDEGFVPGFIFLRKTAEIGLRDICRFDGAISMASLTLPWTHVYNQLIKVHNNGVSAPRQDFVVVDGNVFVIFKKIFTY
jgi:hypothetical protein